MANFSTEFPIDTKNTVEDVVRLSWKWISGSPHTHLSAESFGTLPVDTEISVSQEGEHVSIAMADMEDYQIGGIRYIRTENGLEWTTSIVSLKTADKHVLSLQVICEALNTAARLPPTKKPYFIRQALTELGGGLDGEIPVADRPFHLEDGEASIAAALILGTAHNKLPIIYVSAPFEGEYAVNPDDLARFVSGMAHVVVEPSRRFSYEAKELTGARNAFGGAVGVYWPESDARKTYFLNDDFPTPRDLQIQIAKDVRVALSNRRQRTQCTWLHLKEVVARKRLDAIKATGSIELEEYVEAFDAESEAKDARLRDAEQEIARLSAEVRRLSATRDTTGQESGVLKRGAEQDLYENEIRDIVADAIADSLRSSLEGTRRQHVLSAVVAANPSSGNRDRLAEEIKNLLKTYRDMDARTRSSLARLGFDVTEDGKHYKAVFQGDGRYTFAFSKTSSDHRAGKNLASDINRLLF